MYVCVCVPPAPLIALQSHIHGLIAGRFTNAHTHTRQNMRAVHRQIEGQTNGSAGQTQLNSNRTHVQQPLQAKAALLQVC